MERLLTLYSEVQSTDVRWLWYPFIAIGKITLLQGDPGDGKSTMMMNLIAELSTGGVSLHLQNTSRCCHNINAAKAAVQPFGAFFFVEVANQNDGTVIASSPHSKTAHQFSCPAGNLQIRITAKISLNRVNHDQSRSKFNDCLTDTLIIQCKAVINFFIDESNLPAVCSAAFQTGLNRV